mmetsp:Transcript_21926/g.62886  ORF Transcript_21926/g.62886 Transcript_21926/m.62886 type:complete len:158 (+) Transcript_21926:98-571(+)
MGGNQNAAVAAVCISGAILCALISKVAAKQATPGQFPPPIRAPGIKAWRMSKYVIYGGVLRTQGLCGDFSKMPSSTAQQTAEALEKLDGILNESGLARKNLIAITIYIADISPENFEEMNQVYDKWVDPEGLPTRLCVQAKMGHNAAVEIRAEAFCG